MIQTLKIQANQVAIVYKNGHVINVLTEGKHWLFGNIKIEIHDTTQPLYTTKELNLLLQNEKLASMLEIIEVKDGEAVFQYVNGNFK